MKIKYNHEIISGIVFALISSFLWFSIPTQVKTMEKTAITAQTLPKIAIGGMFVFAVCLLLEGIFMKEKEELNPFIPLPLRRNCAPFSIACSLLPTALW